MMVDTLEERGLSEADVRWGDPNHCHFPLFHFLRPLPLAWMCLLYLLMWCGRLIINTFVTNTTLKLRQIHNFILIVTIKYFNSLEQIASLHLGGSITHHGLHLLGSNNLFGYSFYLSEEHIGTVFEYLLPCHWNSSDIDKV